MWARKCMPPMWPSRLKVMGMIGCQMAVFVSFYQYMRAANILYLNLNAPEVQNIQCLVPELPEACKNTRQEIDDCLAQSDYDNWLFDQSWGQNNQSCSVVPPSVRGRNCENPQLPLSVFKGLAGRLHTYGGGTNFFKSWSYAFVVIALISLMTMMVHDIAILDKHRRSEIYTLADATKEIPNVRNYLMCFGCRKRKYKDPLISDDAYRRMSSTYTTQQTNQSRTYSIDSNGNALEPASAEFYLKRVIARKVLWPLWAVLQSVLFMVVIYPSSLFLFFRYPVRMSRIMTYLTAVISTGWAVIFVIWTLASFNIQYYEIRWEPDAVDRPLFSDNPPDNLSRCLCRCRYPLNLETFGRLGFLGVMLAGHGVCVCLRALKGLRRSEWAVLFSVLQAIPIGAYPVKWTRPVEAGGGPIRFRDEKEPVQDEPAFDPFALMDEQPESGETTIAFQPVCREGRETEYKASFNDGMGHCGFPGPFPTDYHDNRVEVRALNLLRACWAGCFIHPSVDGPHHNGLANVPRADSRHSLASTTTSDF
mmetsp:Transcript_118952/g.219088  ORF Transcript_118952/g.219088 Transcript_118952/m.219088 type:complete len:534 (+) Transcript_118952:54-1655(+)